MIEVDLRTFLMTGRFGPIMLGLSRSQIVKILGWPDAWHPNAKLTAYLWAYGWIELYFDVEDHLCLIRSDHIDALVDNSRFIFNSWILNLELSLHDFEIALVRDQVSYTRIDDPKFKLTYITLFSGVKLYFEPDDDLPLERYLSAFDYSNPLSQPAW